MHLANWYSILDDTDNSYLHQLHVYLIDHPFLEKLTYKDIRISCSLKYKQSKKNGSVGWNKHSGDQH